MRKNIRKFSEDFTRLCKKNENETMIIYDAGISAKRFTYGQALRYTDRYLELFRQYGLKKGDTVFPLLPNSPESILCFFAALKGGYAFAPLPCCATEREIAGWADLVKPKLIIRKKEISIPAEVEQSHTVLPVACDGDLNWLPANAGDTTAEKSGTVYLLTSGTTGAPKAIAIDGDTLWSSGRAFVKFYGFSKCRFWNYLPMSYLGGLFNLALIPVNCGGSFLITEPFSGKTILNFWSTVKKYEITALWFVPTIINGLLKTDSILGSHCGDYCKKKLKIALLGTAPIMKETKERFERMLGVSIYENYATSETTFISAENKNSLNLREESSVGAVLPYVDYRLEKYKDAENIFELWVKTPFMFRGYLNEKGEIDSSADENGFLNTKDLVRVSEAGQLIVIGRDREIIKKGGLFVSLKEIERLVKENGEVRDAAAIPEKHDFYGETYVLYVVFKDQGGDPDAAAAKLKLWLMNMTIPYKQPEAIRVCNAFPYTDSGKIRKEELRKQYER